MEALYLYCAFSYLFMAAYFNASGNRGAPILATLLFVLSPGILPMIVGGVIGDLDK